MLRLGALITLLIPPTFASAQDSLLQEIGTPILSTGLPNGDILYPPLSYDGRYIAFHSTATNLIGNDRNGVGDVFVLDRRANLIARIANVRAGGEPNGVSTYPSLSGNGEYLTFTSEASNLTEGDINERSDVFLADIRGQTLTLVSRKVDGTPATGVSYNYFHLSQLMVGSSCSIVMLRISSGMTKTGLGTCFSSTGMTIASAESREVPGKAARARVCMRLFPGTAASLHITASPATWCPGIAMKPRIFSSLTCSPVKRLSSAVRRMASWGTREANAQVYPTMGKGYPIPAIQRI